MRRAVLLVAVILVSTWVLGAGLGPVLAPCASPQSRFQCGSTDGSSPGTTARTLTGALPSLGRHLLTQQGSSAAAQAPPAARPVLLLAAPEFLAPAAEAWRSHRTAQGWDVEIIAIAAGSSIDAPALRALLRERARTHLGSSSRIGQTGAQRVDVLLLGDSDVLPTFRFPQPDPRLVDHVDREFSSDHPYQLLDDADEVPDLALGRIPVRSVEAALAVLEKIRRYEQAPEEEESPWRHRLTFVAGEGRFGAADSILESLFRTLVDRMVPDRFEMSMTYASPTSIYCPPPSRLEQTIADRFAEPALLVNYLGHGYAHGLDRMRWGRERIPMLTLASMDRFSQPRSSLPIAFFGCCSVGWFDREGGEPSLAERLLEAPGGPVAIIAGSRPTHPYGTAVLQKDLVQRLLHERVATVGELDLEATRSMLQIDSDDAVLDLMARPLAAVGRWPCSLQELRLMHVRLYNLLGDPTTRIAHPPLAPGALRLEGAMLRGLAPGVRSGRALIVVETIRDASAAGVLHPAASPDAADLEAVAGANYPRANARTLWRGEVAVRNERFEISLPEPLPSGAAIIRSVVVGLDSDGHSVEGLDALRLPADR